MEGWIIAIIIIGIIALCVSAAIKVSKAKARNAPQYHPRVDTTQVQSFSQSSAPQQNLPYPSQPQNLPYPSQPQNMPQPPSTSFNNSQQPPVSVVFHPTAMPAPSNPQNIYPPSTSQTPSDPPPPYNQFMGSSEESNTKKKY